jgi:dihydroneopterin aldolase
MTASDLDAITLQAMSFHTLIGVLPHEREHPQPLEVDLTAWVAGGSRLVDYRDLYAQVRAATSAPDLLYLEQLADLVAARVLANHAVRRVRVAVRKPHAAVGGPLRFAEVAIVRQQNE